VTAKLIIDDYRDTTVTADKFKVADGFLQFKNASLNNSEKEEEVWIPIGIVKTIIWKDKPEEEEKKEDKKE